MLTDLMANYLLTAVPATGDENMKLVVALLLVLSLGGSAAAFLCTVLIRRIINKHREKKQ